MKMQPVFQTNRLSVFNWPGPQFGGKPDISLADKILGILTPPVTQYLPEEWSQVGSAEDALAWLEDRLAECSLYAVNLKASNELAGFLFLYFPDPQSQLKDCRFGYLLSESFWGKGLGTELIKGLVQWCMNEGKMGSLIGGVETANTGSIRVLEKAGFSVSPSESSNADTIFYEYRFT